MDRFELEDGLKSEIRARVFDEGFMKIVQTVRRNGKVFKIAMRPVEIGGVKRYQAEMTDEGRVTVKNFDEGGAKAGLEEIIAQKGAREMHLMTASGDLHIRVTKKGHVLASRSAEMNREVFLRPHDRVKNVPLSAFDSTTLLKAIGLADSSGKIKASMRGKYDQVNDFLKVVKETLNSKREGTFTVVDCGSGKAYLTFALYFYLTEVLKYESVKVIGIDRRSDVVAISRKIATALDVANKVEFIEGDLGSVKLDRADMIVSLHACDTATDEAIAKGVELKSRYILSAPCCQHELQKTLKDGGAFAGLMRQSILRERLCDILTDVFRAMILRILGYKVQVIEFVAHEATARNIMLKCEAGAKSGQAIAVGEYLSLRDYWHVTPWLETRLMTLLKKHLDAYT